MKKLADCANCQVPLFERACFVEQGRGGAGCPTLSEKELVEKLNPNASMIGPDSISEVVYVAKETMKGNKVVILRDYRIPKLGLPRRRENRVIGIVPIAIGCM